MFDLDPLTDEQADTLITALDPSLSAQDRAAVVARCDGVPFYIEQVVWGLGETPVGGSAETTLVWADVLGAAWHHARPIGRYFALMLIAGVIASEYDVAPEVAARDTAEFLRDLAHARAVVLQPGEESAR